MHSILVIPMITYIVVKRYLQFRINSQNLLMLVQIKSSCPKTRTKRSENNYKMQAPREVSTLEEYSVDKSSDEPKGMSQFMKSIQVKATKLAFPALVYLGVTAGTVVTLASGGPIAPAVIALGTETIKLMSAIKDAYKKKKNLCGVLTTQQSDVNTTDMFMLKLMEGLGDKIVDEMEHLGSSLKEDLRLIRVTLEKLDLKIERLLLEKDKTIETTYAEVTKEIRRKSYQNALKCLEDLSLTRMRIESNLPVDSARLKITEAL